MIKTNAKVIADKLESKLLITILPNISPLFKTGLLVWVVLWFVMGIAVAFYYPSAAEDEKTLLIVYLGFWLYFLYISAKGLLWNLIGSENLMVENGELTYKRSWKGYGKVLTYDGDTIDQLGVLKLDNNSFGKIYGEAFWTVGGEKLGFEYIGNKVVFGMKVSDKDADKIAKLIGRQLKLKKH